MDGIIMAPITEFLISFSTVFLIPVMLGVFVLGFAARCAIYLLIRGERKFTVEFEARIERYVNHAYGDVPAGLSFHQLTKKMLDKTFYEYFILKAQRRRRKYDTTESILDRLLCLKLGAGRLITDTLRQTRYHEEGKEPDFERVSRFVFNSNPYYNKLFGVVPTQPLDSFLNVLPGVFVICGILGTFIGVVAGLPELQSLDVTNSAAANATMSRFLEDMGFAMHSSIAGMILSLIMTVANSVMASYGMFVETVENFKVSLSFAWLESKGHMVDALAEQENLGLYEDAEKRAEDVLAKSHDGPDRRRDGEVVAGEGEAPEDLKKAG